jgi:hypothetical protein
MQFGSNGFKIVHGPRRANPTEGDGAPLRTLCARVSAMVNCCRHDNYAAGACSPGTRGQILVACSHRHSISEYDINFVAQSSMSTTYGKFNAPSSLSAGKRGNSSVDPQQI